MGFGRTGRFGKMRFYRDRPDVLTDVVWYIVPRDREALGIPTIFGNRMWEWSHVGDSLGDVPVPIRYYGGPPPVPSSGCGRIGTEEQWLHGCLSTDPLPPVDAFTGQPTGCCGRVHLGLGGTGYGAPDPTHYLLQENEGRILQENGGGLLWE